MLENLHQKELFCVENQHATQFDVQSQIFDVHRQIFVTGHHIF